MPRETASRENSSESPGPGTILLVEDDPVDVLLLESALSKFHPAPKLLVLTDGAQAITYVEDIERNGKACPDLFVLDLNLPKKNGFEILKKIRRSQMCARTPVVMLSSQDGERERAEAERLGATLFLKKALDFDGLLEIGSKLKALLVPVLPGEAISLV